MLKYFLDLWNRDITESDTGRIATGLVLLSVVVIGLGYALAEVLLALGNADYGFNIFKYVDTVRNGNTFSFTYGDFEKNFPHIWLILASGCVAMRTYIIVRSYFLSKAEIGEARFKQVFVSGLSAFVVGSVSCFAFVGLLGTIAWLAGWIPDWDENIVGTALANFTHFIDTRVPSLVTIDHFWVAFILSLVLGSFPGYFVHWLSHRSRFFWLVTHRAHHVMEYLHPLAAPPAFNFDFFISVPSVLSSIIISKFIYHEPLVKEMILWGTLGYYFEIFNHAVVYYPLSLKNPVISFASQLFGGSGVYHLIHHSAKPEDHTVNVGGGPFLLWDRVFGTYRKAYDKAPPLGLIDQPPLHWNPFRITFNGIIQMAYEWKHNRDWNTRFRIIFGNIWYKPPVTKDFLLKDQEQVMAYPA